MADEHEPGRIEETALPILNNGFAAGGGQAGHSVIPPARANKPHGPHDGVHEAYSYVVMLRKNSRFRK